MKMSRDSLILFIKTLSFTAFVLLLLMAVVRFMFATPTQYNGIWNVGSGEFLLFAAAALAAVGYFSLFLLSRLSVVFFALCIVVAFAAGTVGYSSNFIELPGILLGLILSMVFWQLCSWPKLRMNSNRSGR